MLQKLNGLKSASASITRIAKGEYIERKNIITLLNTLTYESTSSIVIYAKLPVMSFRSLLKHIPIYI